MDTLQLTSGVVIMKTKHCHLYKEKGRKACFSDGSVCGSLGKYPECPRFIISKVIDSD